MKRLYLYSFYLYSFSLDFLSGCCMQIRVFPADERSRAEWFVAHVCVDPLPNQDLILFKTSCLLPGLKTQADTSHYYYQFITNNINNKIQYNYDLFYVELGNVI